MSILVTTHIWEDPPGSTNSNCPVLPPVPKPGDFLSTLPISQRRDRGLRWKGLAVPLVRYRDGHFSSRLTSALVRSSIIAIVTTARGSRIMSPNFGSSIPHLIFEPNDDILRAQVMSTLPSDIRQWEPRIDEPKVTVKAQKRDISIQLFYTIKETNEQVEDHINFQRGQPTTLRLVGA